MNRLLTFSSFLMLIIVFILFRWILGFDGLYGQDAYEYYRYAGSLREYLLTGTPPGDYFWPVWYPLSGALLSLLIPNISFCLQLISVISLWVIFLYCIKITSLVFPGLSKQTPVYFGLLLLVSPFMIRFAVSAMPDMYTLATLITGYYHIYLFIKQHKKKQLFLGSSLLAISFMSRYASALLIIPILLFTIYHGIKHRKLFIYIPLVLVATIPVFLPHIIIRGENSTHFILHDWVIYWSPRNFLQNSFTTNDGQSSYILPNIIYSFGGLFHPRYFILGIPISIIASSKFRWNPEIKFISIALAIYLLFLSGIPFQNNRFLLLALPFLLIIYYQPAIYILQCFKPKVQTTFIIVVAIFQISLFLISFKNVYFRMLTEKEIYEYVIKTQPSSIYTLDIDISLNGRGCNIPIHNIWTNYYSDPDNNGIIIFNTETFPKQWAGMNPMRNWEQFNKTNTVIELKSFKQGWKVYGFK